MPNIVLCGVSHLVILSEVSHAFGECDTGDETPNACDTKVWYTTVVFFAPFFFPVASGTRRVRRNSTRVLGRVMRQNFGSKNNISPIRVSQKMKSVDFSSVNLSILIQNLSTDLDFLKLPFMLLFCVPDLQWNLSACRSFFSLAKKKHSSLV